MILCSCFQKLTPFPDGGTNRNKHINDGYQEPSAPPRIISLFCIKTFGIKQRQQIAEILILKHKLCSIHLSLFLLPFLLYRTTMILI